jgi:hypothetical protein
LREFSTNITNILDLIVSKVIYRLFIFDFSPFLYLTIFLTVYNAQVVLGPGVKGDPLFFGGFLNIALGYGLAVMMGILASGGVRYISYIKYESGFLKE